MFSVRPPDFDPTAFAQRSLKRILHRETVRLALLIAIAVATVFLTRALARTTRAMDRQEAAEWFDRGHQKLRDGDSESAIVAFRRAASKERGEKRYVLALARVLAETHDFDAAERALLRIRESEPDDPDINLALARVAGGRNDIITAIRYYHNALYGPWQTAEGPRSVRLELIRFLVGHGEHNRAISELIAATVDLPPEAARHVALGDLFAQAGDQHRALDQYTRALRLAPHDGSALIGAGRAAFALRDYQAARQYLRDVKGDAEAQTLRTIANLITARDPFAPRIGAAERRRRLLANIDFARQRIAECIAPRVPMTGAALLAEIDAFAQPRGRRIELDADAIESAFAAVVRVEQQATSACGETPQGRALLLVAERHGVAPL